MKAAIDIGTNTVLLLVGALEKGSLKVIHEEQRMPRLGKGVDSEGKINEASTDRVTGVLLEYRRLLEDQFPEVKEVIVTATSAVRDAVNRETFMSYIEDKTGYKIRLLSGKEEAEWTYQGAVAVFDKPIKSDVMVLDIGGGSTEVALGREGKLIKANSFDMGCVRFTERYLKHDPPFYEEIGQCREETKRLFSSFRFRPKKKVTAVGVAGTMTSLAAIDLQLDEYEPSRFNGHVIERNKLSKGIELFSLHTHEQLLELSPNVMKGREDIFLAGLLILEEFLKYYSLDSILVSTGGIRHGAILNSENL